MNAELAVVCDRIVTPRGPFSGAILVEGGRISALVQDPKPKARRVLDVTGNLVFPGFIDGHVHFRDPAHQDKEDFTSGTRANAAAGVTTVLEMPMADVGIGTVQRFRERRATLAPKAVIDWGMWGGGGAEAVDEIQGMAREGAVGFKTFAREIYAARAANFEGTAASTDGMLLRVAREVAATGRVWAVHAENYNIVQTLGAEVDANGLWNGVDGFIAIRPEMIEVEPVGRLILIAREAGARLQIAHITTAAALSLVKAARYAGQAVTAEACPPHLTFTESDVARLGALGHFTPRLRPASDREALWDGLAGGWIAMVSSDHSSWTRRDLDEGWDGMGRAPRHFATVGSASAEFLSGVVLTGAASRGIGLEQIARVLSEGPARLTGIWPKKGCLAPGSDADLTIVDPSRTWIARGASMESKAKVTPFEGMTLTGKPTHTIVRGEIVMENGQIAAEPGFGQFQRPVSSGTHA